MKKSFLIYASLALTLGFIPSELGSSSWDDNKINPIVLYNLQSNAGRLEERMRELERRRIARVNTINRITSLIPKSEPYITTIMDACEDDSIITPYHLAAVLNIENQPWNPKAKSKKGAKGLGQLMNGTAKEVGVRDPFNPTQNIFGSYFHLSNLMNRYNGNLVYALAAYNAGSKHVDDWICNRKWRGEINRIPYKETREHVKSVLSTLEYLSKI